MMIEAVKIVFTEFGLPKKILLDADTNFISDKLRQFCKQLNIEQAIPHDTISRTMDS